MILESRNNYPKTKIIKGGFRRKVQLYLGYSSYFQGYMGNKAQPKQRRAS